MAAFRAIWISKTHLNCPALPCPVCSPSTAVSETLELRAPGWDCDVRFTCREVPWSHAFFHAMCGAGTVSVIFPEDSLPPFSPRLPTSYLTWSSTSNGLDWRDVTYEQYVHAVTSNRVGGWRLVPPVYPIIQAEYLFEFCPTRNHQMNCPDQGSWHGVITHSFNGAEEALTASTHRCRFWCLYWDKPLFPMTCSGHEDDWFKIQYYQILRTIKILNQSPTSKITGPR